VSEQDQPQGPAVDPQEVVNVIKYCVNFYAVDHDLDTEQITSVTVEDLVKWCIVTKMPISDKAYLTGDVKTHDECPGPAKYVAPEAVDAVWEQIQNPYAACKLLLPIWAWVMEKRPPLAVLPEEMELISRFKFRDHTGMEIRVVTPFADKPIHGGFVVSLMYDQAINMLNSLAVNGMDEMREKWAQPLASAG
jgi:hypothetical protein